MSSKATCPVSTAEVKRVFSAQTSDRHFPSLLDPDACLSTLDRDRGSEGIVHGGALWGVGGVVGGGGAEEVLNHDGGLQDEVVVVS